MGSFGSVIGMGHQQLSAMGKTYTGVRPDIHNWSPQMLMAHLNFKGVRIPPRLRSVSVVFFIFSIKYSAVYDLHMSIAFHELCKYSTGKYKNVILLSKVKSSCLLATNKQ